jgi:predicted metal-dependent enzyme (double-stranded beta helix superfamily)
VRDPYTLQGFIADVDRIARTEPSPALITERVAPLLARLVVIRDAVPPRFRQGPVDGGRGRYLLHRAPHFNVSSVIWRPGDYAAPHNHETWGVIGVIENEIEETRYRLSRDPTGAARLVVTQVLHHRPGAVSRLVPGDEIHAMRNGTDRDTLEIHVYGKDLVGLRRRSWEADGTEKPLVSPKYLNC